MPSADGLTSQAATRRLLTPSGLGVAVVALVALVVGSWWQYEELVVLAVGLVAALLVALWSSRAGRPARVVRRLSTPRVARGEDIRIVYRVSNPRRRRSAPAVVVDRCDGEVAAAEFPSLAPHDRTDVRSRLPTRRRGVHQLGPSQVERSDPLHLAIGRRTHDDRTPVIVHPKVWNLVGPYGATHIVEDEAVIRRVASDPLSGFVSLREYVSGDDPRLIHWPTTARTGTLMLREHVELRRPEFTVVVDAADSVATADDFEEMVDVAASIAVHAIRSGVDVTLRTTSRRHPGVARQLSSESLVLDLLTPVVQIGADAAMSLAELFRDGFDHTALVMVTGPDGPSRALPFGQVASVIRVGAGASPAPGIAMAVDDAETFSQRWRPWR